MTQTQRPLTHDLTEGPIDRLDEGKESIDIDALPADHEQAA